MMIVILSTIIIFFLLYKILKNIIELKFDFIDTLLLVLGLILTLYSLTVYLNL